MVVMYVPASLSPRPGLGCRRSVLDTGNSGLSLNPVSWTVLLSLQALVSQDCKGPSVLGGD
jgi:hypothetical protein